MRGSLLEDDTSFIVIRIAPKPPLRLILIVNSSRSLVIRDSLSLSGIIEHCQEHVLSHQDGSCYQAHISIIAQYHIIVYYSHVSYCLLKLASLSRAHLLQTSYIPSTPRMEETSLPKAHADKMEMITRRRGSGPCSTAPIFDRPHCPPCSSTTASRIRIGYRGCRQWRKHGR